MVHRSEAEFLMDTIRGPSMDIEQYKQSNSTIIET